MEIKEIAHLIGGFISEPRYRFSGREKLMDGDIAQDLNPQWMEIGEIAQWMGNNTQNGYTNWNISHRMEK